MDKKSYETHYHADPDFPVIFHLDTLQDRPSRFHMHWHESIEILYLLEGRIQVACGLHEIAAEKGDTVVINGNEIHWIGGGPASYYCLIVDSRIYNSLQMEISSFSFCHLIRQDRVIAELFSHIAQERELQEFGYKEQIKALSLQLGIYLSRQYQDEELQNLERGSKSKIQMVKQALDYMKANLCQAYSLDQICEAVGVSRYYFCHVFKEITGKTPVETLNLLRCQKACSLLAAGTHTVGEVAELLGFSSQQYFSRLYKKYMGVSPSLSRTDSENSKSCFDPPKSSQKAPEKSSFAGFSQ